MPWLKIFLLALCLIMGMEKSVSASPKLTDVTIVVSSCDKYGDLWDPFFKLLFRYWPSLKTYNKGIPIILISNERDFTVDGVQTYKTGKDAGWSSNMLKVLKSVKTKYILYFQEDYLMSGPVNEKRLQYLIQKMKEQNIATIEINKGSYYKGQIPYPKIKGVIRKGDKDDFRASLQSGLWDTKVFQGLLKEKESAWVFESEGTERSKILKDPFLIVSEEFPVVFVNACHLGFLEKSAVSFLKKEGISLKNINLPVNSDYPFTLWFRHNIYPHAVFKRWVKILKLLDPKIL